MKSIKHIILALAASAALVSCGETIRPDQSYSKIILPDGITMMFNDPSAYEITARFTDASISGIVAFVGNTESLPADYYDNLTVEINLGKDGSNLTDTRPCTLGTPEVDEWNAVVPFSIQLGDLNDGEYYLFSAKATYAGDKIIVNPVTGFFTFPAGPVDLDLQSGNLWASANLGAEFPGEAGNYYAWGETEVSEFYVWPFYKWCYWRNPDFFLTKYCNYALWGKDGFEDGLESMESADDAATQTLGDGWHIPSVQDWTELVEQASWKAAQVGGVSGLLVRSKSNPNDSGKVIFIPFAGFMEVDQKKAENEAGAYWTSQVYESVCMQAYSFGINSSSRSVNPSTLRCNGLSIRPVKSK